ncbi:ATP-binding protein [Pseudonocardia humida]|uniref:ATP-binding protein n=1 Tax=Pseudonocardia humida TaxID=2800819 RepID=A0ABT1AB02_9PSEU|nr:ATP-binding protein [Pseudonocardia humida]MCO1660204.1 ATP-binding protein [Pseudonocardia humida]
MSREPYALPEGMTIAARETGAAVVLTVDGELTLRSAPRLRAVLEQQVADRGRVLVDVSGLRIAFPSAVEVFPMALASLCGWPEARLVLFGARPATVRVLRAAPYLTEAVHLADTEDAALRMLELRPRRLSRRTELEYEPDAARWARYVVEAVCRDWEVADDDAASAAQIVASELVTNAIVHARTASVLTVTSAAESLRVAVRDYDPAAAPERTDALPELARGLGLVVVAGVSRSWGVTPHLDGKSVWAVVPRRTPPG